MTDRVIATIQKNQRMELRIGLSSYQGHKLLQTRLWAHPKGVPDDIRPTGKGWVLSIEQIDAVIDALRDTKAAAIAEGWLEGGSEAA